MVCALLEQLFYLRLIMLSKLSRLSKVIFAPFLTFSKHWTILDQQALWKGLEAAGFELKTSQSWADHANHLTTTTTVHIYSC